MFGDLRRAAAAHSPRILPAPADIAKNTLRMAIPIGQQADVARSQRVYDDYAAIASKKPLQNGGKRLVFDPVSSGPDRRADNANLSDST